MKNPRLEPGDWYVVDDRSGFRIPASWSRFEWNGALVWDRLYEARQPQDYLRGIKDDQSVPFARPQAQPIFLGTNEVTADDL